LVCGEAWAGDNPRLVVPQEFHEFIRLWSACRGESGIAHWPDAGGLGDQAAWVVDAFAALAGLDYAMREADRKQRGG